METEKGIKNPTKPLQDQPESIVKADATLKVKYLSDVPCHFDYQKKGYSLHIGKEYDLPNIPFVTSLIAQKKLEVIK